MKIRIGDWLNLSNEIKEMLLKGAFYQTKDKINTLNR
jgi:hypothetical protein